MVKTTGDRSTYRNTTGSVISIIMFSLLFFLGTGPLFEIKNTILAIAYVPVLVVVAYFGWRLLLRPKLVVDNEGVTVVNAFRTVALPWADISDVTLVYSQWSGTTLEVTYPTDSVRIGALGDHLNSGKALFQQQVLKDLEARLVTRRAT